MPSDPEKPADKARAASAHELDHILHERSREIVEAVLENPALEERHLLVLLSRKGLEREFVVRIAQNRAWMRSYRMKAAVVKHPRTPRHIALPFLKYIYLFDLLAIAKTPGTAPDLKRLAEDSILSQLGSIALGQKLSLARQGSNRIAKGLLDDKERRVIEAALANPAMTDLAVAEALLMEKSGPALTDAAIEHPLWRARLPVKLALVRSRHLSLARFANIVEESPLADLRDLKDDPRLEANLRAYVAKMVASRRKRTKKSDV